MNNLKNKIIIKKLEDINSVPYELLLLADPSKDLVKEYISRGICYTAVIESNTIGVYVLIKTRPSTMEIVNIAVDEEFQGQGIGKKLILDAIKRARNFGIKTLEIGTGNSSLSQLGLYQKCGFRLLGIDKDFFIRHYEEEIFENGIKCTDMIRLYMDL